MDAMAVNGTESLPTECVAVSDMFVVYTWRNRVLTRFLQAIDTGTSLIYVPDEVAKQFYAMVRG